MERGRENKKQFEIAPKLFLYDVGVIFLFDNAQLFTDLDEGSQCAIQLFTRVSGRQLDTNTGLSFRYNRVVESGNIDVFFL